MIIIRRSAELTVFELGHTTAIGEARNEDVLQNKRVGYGPSKQFDRKYHIIGAQGEYACSLMLNLYWKPHIGQVGQNARPDVGGCVEVKTTECYHNPHLPVPTDARDYPHVLIVKDDLRFEFRGWISKRDAAAFPVQEFDHPCYWVPEAKLDKDPRNLDRLLRGELKREVA